MLTMSLWQVVEWEALEVCLSAVKHKKRLRLLAGRCLLFVKFSQGSVFSCGSFKLLLSQGY